MFIGDSITQGWEGAGKEAWKKHYEGRNAVNLGIGLLVGLAAFGFSFAALILAAAVYVSSSGVAIKGLIDFRRLADEETDLVLGILVFEDLAIALVLGFAATGGGSGSDTLEIVAKAVAFIAASLAASTALG